MKLPKAIVALLLLLSAYNASAHALWLQTSGTGKKGTPHEVIVYFAEPAQQKELLDSKEWSMAKGFDLWAVSPSGKQFKLEAKPQKDCYAATFTPEEEGLYRVLLKHERIGVLTFDGTGSFVPYFYACTNVWIGNDHAVANVISPDRSLLPMSILPVLSKGTQKVFFHATLPEGLKYQITVFSPSGKRINIAANGSNQLVFDAIEQGGYQVEVSAVDTKPGTIGGREYQKAFHIATTTFEIK